MKHGIMDTTDLERLANEQELLDRYAARWDSQAAPYDPAVSAEERRLYRVADTYEAGRLKPARKVRRNG